MDFDKLVEALSPEEALTLFRSLRARLDSKAVNSDELELARTNKINAIRAYRARTGSTLKDGKEAVETAMSEAGLLRSPTVESLVTDDELVILRTQGEIEAIKAYRKRTGRDLIECKHAIEAVWNLSRW